MREGAEGPGGCLQGIRGRGAKYFFSGPEGPPRKETQTQLLGPDILRCGGGLTREGVGAEKFGMSLETRETKLFWRDIPGFCRDIPEVPGKFERKKSVFNFRSLCSCLSYLRRFRGFRRFRGKATREIHPNPRNPSGCL